MAVVRRAFLSGSVMDVVITFSIAVNATYIGLSLLGYIRLGAAPAMRLSSGLLVLLLFPLYFQPLRAMAAAYHSKERALAAAPTIIALLSEAEVQEVVRPAPSPAGTIAVVLDDVGFRHADSDRSVLESLDRVFDSGQWTAVVGPSGVGKTTLLSLIAGPAPTDHRNDPMGHAHRRLVPTARWMCVDRPADGRAPSAGSIGDNVRIGRPTADQSEIEQAVAAAGLTDVVARLPGGLDTLLGEGGSGVSTGEARRIAIARAFLSDAALWLLDEPTAHLDPDAEAMAMIAPQVAPGPTRILCSGRTSIESIPQHRDDEVVAERLAVERVGTRPQRTLRPFSRAWANTRRSSSTSAGVTTCARCSSRAPSNSPSFSSVLGRSGTGCAVALVTSVQPIP